MSKQDEHGVLKENIGFDELLGRDYSQYMRLEGTEKSFFCEPDYAELYEKKPNGKYQLIKEGTLIFTTRRLVFCGMSLRGKIYNSFESSFKFAIGGAFIANKFRKKEDFILFSYPSFLLLGNEIKDSEKKSKDKRYLNKELIIDQENIKFIFSIPINKSEKEQERDRNQGIQEYQVDTFNNLMSENLEQYMAYMKFLYDDTELYPSWDYHWEWDAETDLEPDALTTKERNKLKKELSVEFEKYINFTYQES